MLHVCPSSTLNLQRHDILHHWFTSETKYYDTVPTLLALSYITNPHCLYYWLVLLHNQSVLSYITGTNFCHGLMPSFIINPCCFTSLSFLTIINLQHSSVTCYSHRFPFCFMVPIVTITIYLLLFTLFHVWACRGFLCFGFGAFWPLTHHWSVTHCVHPGYVWVCITCCFFVFIVKSSMLYVHKSEPWPLHVWHIMQ